MSKDQADKECMKIIQQVNEKHEKIIRKAKAEGKWKMGLDSNRELFKEVDDEAKGKIKKLASMIDE